MTKDHNPRKFAPIEPVVFFPSIAIVALAAIAMIAFPAQAAAKVSASYAFIMKNLSSMFMFFGFFAFATVIVLGFGRYGNTRLGGPDEKPEFSTFSWISMLFCAGIGIGIMIWSVVEPIYYISNPPMGIKPQSDLAYTWAHMLPLFHWGFSAWAIYCLPTIPIAYSVYVRREKIFRISESSRPILGKQADGAVGKFIEIVVLLGTVGAIGTSLGLAIPLISRLLSSMFGAPDDLFLKSAVTVILFVLFGGSVYLGIEKGLKNLTRFNVWGAILLLFLVLGFGPTGFIFDLLSNSLGLLFNNFFGLTFQTEPLRLLETPVRESWPQNWTVFYWAWWVAYAPITALFVASISRGRTIKELVLAECLWGTLGCWIFMAIFGAYSLYAQKSGLVDVVGIQANSGDPAACLAVMSSLGAHWLIVPLYAIMCFVFLATTLQAASYSLANLCVKKGHSDKQPERWNRMLWASLVAVFGLGILVAGGEKALKTVQTSTIVGGVIIVPIILVLVASLFKSLRQDFAGAFPTGGIVAPIFKKEAAPLSLQKNAAAENAEDQGKGGGAR
ncbi:MAG: BCCT family transporter [Deltaproteobacteria bacterium]|jgi:BCCT family betaine/carnitine transporter|nr:BCCT family transporter [Deltaproteobacteria bacterium]